MKIIKYISFMFLILIIFFIIIITFSIGCLRLYDKDVVFNKMNKNNSSFNGDYIFAGDKYGDSTNIILTPSIGVNNKSYIILAEELSKNDCDVYISSFLLDNIDILTDNSYIHIYNSFVTSNNDFYLVVHGNLLDSGKYFMKNHISDIKGIIYLDGFNKELINKNIRTLCIYSDDFELDKNNYPLNTEYYHIEGGSFDGYANYINKDLNELSWQRQQRIVIDRIVEFINEGR